jgi:hypothetical protein
MVEYFPTTTRVILNIDNSKKFLKAFEDFGPNIARDLGITETAANEIAKNIGADVYIRPKGLHGKIYNILKTAQNTIPMIHTTNVLTLAKTTGLSGISIVTAAPLTFVGASYVGSVFFGYCGAVAGNNSVGIVLNTTSFVLSRPMWGLELVLNGLILTPLSNVVGLPLMLNATAEITAGMGIRLKEYKKIAFAFERVVNSKALKNIKLLLRKLRKS